MHLDRGRVAAQVAEHVLEDLEELDEQAWDFVRDAPAYVGDDLLDPGAGPLGGVAERSSPHGSPT